MARETKQATGNGMPAAVDYRRLMSLSSANVDALMKASEAMMKGIAKLNEEIVSFTNSRFKEQIEGSRAIAQCDNWSDAVEQHMTMARSATELYLAEASRLANLAAEVTMASWAPFQSYLHERLSETPRAERRAEK